MKREIIYNLLVCATDYSQSSKNAILNNLEELDSNLDAFDHFINEFIEKLEFEPDIRYLVNCINKFSKLGSTIDLIYDNKSKLWDLIKILAIYLLDSLEVEYMNPGDYVEFAWGDEE